MLCIYLNLNPYLYDFLRTMECQVFIDVNCFDIENTNNTQNKVSTAGKKEELKSLCVTKKGFHIYLLDLTRKLEARVLYRPEQ